MHLRRRLRPTFSALAAHLGTITELARQTPVAVVAEVLGYRTATIESHAATAGVDYGNYISTIDVAADRPS